MVVYPVGEIPARQVLQSGTVLLVAVEIVQNLFHARQQIFYQFPVRAVHQVIMNSVDIAQRIRGDVLRRGVGWGTSHGDTLRITAQVRLSQEVLGQTVITSVKIGDKSLDTRVAQVLKLFIVRAVHIGLESTQTGGSPAYLQNLLQFLVVGV